MTIVRDILKAKADQAVYTTTADASVADAVNSMAKHKVGALVVVDGAKVVGIVTERDVSRRILGLSGPPAATPVAEIMTRSVMVVPPKCSSQECMSLMTEHRLRHLPVIEDERLVGLVSIGDLVKDILSEQKFIIEQLEHYITGDRV